MKRLGLIIAMLFVCFGLLSAQTKVIGNISGKPPYTRAFLKISFGSFPKNYDSVAVKDGKFEFLIPDTLLLRQPLIASIVFQTTKKSMEFMSFTNYIIPKRKNNNFYLGDTTIVFTGVYDSTKRQQTYTINRTAENDVYLGEFTRSVFKWGTVRPTAVDSMVDYIKTYPDSKCLLNEIFERRRWLSGQQLKSMVNTFSPEALSSTKGEKLTIYLENKLGEESHSEYTNLVLKNRKGKDAKIFDQLEDANLIIFWASWCVPCRKEMPILKKLYETLKAKGVSFQFTHVSVDAKKELWEKADKQIAFPWKSLWAPKEETVAKAYNYGLPSNHLVTKDKRIYRIDVRHQEGIDEIYKALGLKPEKFEYPEEKGEIKTEH
jgi:thiol-disulfide isomerase/thioredoxin